MATPGKEDDIMTMGRRDFLASTMMGAAAVSLVSRTGAQRARLKPGPPDVLLGTKQTRSTDLAV